MVGYKNSYIESDVRVRLKSHIRKTKKNVEVLLNPDYKDMAVLYLTFPKNYDVAGPEFDKFCEERMKAYMPGFKIQDYLKSTVVHPQRFSFDFVLTYPRKDPVFIELNNFYHYYVIEGKNNYESLARQLALDFAKQKLITAHGYKFVEVRTVDVPENEYINTVKKVV